MEVPAPKNISYDQDNNLVFISSNYDYYQTETVNQSDLDSLKTEIIGLTTPDNLNSLQELANTFPEINRYTRVGPMVPEVPPISEELAYATIDAFGLDSETGNINFDIVGLKQHGIVVIAEDAWSAFEHVERLEHICQIALAAKQS